MLISNIFLTGNTHGILVGTIKPVLSDSPAPKDPAHLVGLWVPFGE